MKNEKYYYKINGDGTVYVCGTLDFEELIMLLLSFECKILSDYCMNFQLDSFEIAEILIKHYAFDYFNLNECNKEILEILIPDQLDDCGFEQNCGVHYFSNLPKKVEIDIMKFFQQKNSCYFFVDLSPLEDSTTYTEALSLLVNIGGATVTGLDTISNEMKNKIIRFFPDVQFLDKNIFFSFEKFPLDRFTFEWNGRHISIKEINNKIKDRSWSFIKQMDIGYFITTEDYNFPINSIYELDILKKNMRLKNNDMFPFSLSFAKMFNFY